MNTKGRDTTEVAAQNFVAMMDFLAHGLGATVRGNEGARWFRTGSSFDLFNAIFVSAGSPDLDAALERAAAELADVPASVWLLPEAPPDAQAAIERLGFREVGGWPAMVLELDRAPEVGRDRLEQTGGVSITRVGSGEDFDRLLEASAVVNQPPEIQDAFAQASRAVGFGRDAPVSHFLLTVDGQPASCATLLFGPPHVAGIYSVGTVERFQRRGLGRLVTEAALDDARSRGATAATLQTSDAGRRLYEQLGFRDVAEFRRFTDPAGNTLPVQEPN